MPEFVGATFQRGERVRLLLPSEGLDAGIVGVVTGRYTDDESYVVRFGEAEARIPFNALESVETGSGETGAEVG